MDEASAKSFWHSGDFFIQNAENAFRQPTQFFIVDLMTITMTTY
jgi:hypothetical protein